MPRYNYKAKTSAGETKKGVVEAADPPQAAMILKEKGYVVISVNLKSEGVLATLYRRFFNRVGMNEVVNFTRQLSTMISAGLVITDALTILKSQTENPNMVAVIDSTQKYIEGGSSFSEALKRNPQVFDAVYIALVHSGETAGVLDKILSRLADNLEKKREFTGKIRGAMVYPVIIISGMLLVGGVMIIFVVPQLLDLYQEFEATLPTATIILMAISRLMTTYWWIGLGLLLLAGLVLKRLLQTEYGKMRLDAIISSLPIVGRLRRAMMLTEFTRTLGLLVGGGILIVDALTVTIGSVGSIIYKKAIKQAVKEVERGQTLAVALAKADVFPPLLPQMVSVGEETGKLDEVLLKISSYFEQEGEVAIRGLTTAIEPIIMILLGVGVGFLIISVIMPIYNLTSQF